jgi:hypothetical protein
MAPKDRRIIFMRGDTLICDLPLDAYEAGDITETKEKLAQEMDCTPEEIEVRITGIEDGRIHRHPPQKITLVNPNIIKMFPR